MVAVHKRTAAGSTEKAAESRTITDMSLMEKMTGLAKTGTTNV